MSRKRNRVRLSAGEMELMSLLWAEGPVTLAEAHRGFDGYGRPVSYPTMQTRLNRLVDKKLAARSDDRPARYEAVISQEEAAAGHLDQMLEKLTCESVAPLVSQLISERPLTSEEITELKKLLSRAERSASNGPLRHKRST